MRPLDSFTDADFRRTVIRAMKLLAAFAVAAAALLWWRMGWPSAVLLLIGAVISGSGLFEWLRLMTAVMERMDNGERVRPLWAVLGSFFLRLVAAVVLLYVSLKMLDGSVLALAAGLALGVFALTIEALRLVKAWTA